MGQWSDGRRLRRLVLPPVACLLAAGLAVALAAGCGSGGASTTRSTRTVVAVRHLARDRWTYARERFRETCGGCHTLRDAGTYGRRFDLDHAGDISVELARHAIAEGEPGMPAWFGVLSKREYEELVAYVTTVAQNTPGDTRWSWQMTLRSSGEQWSPTDTRDLEARYANETGGAVRNGRYTVREGVRAR